MIYDLNTIGIAVEVIDGSGRLIGTLKDDKRPTRYNAALDALESLILAHACEGINVCESKYVAGVGTALDAIDNNLG